MKHHWVPKHVKYYVLEAEHSSEKNVRDLEELLNDHSIYNELFGVNIEVPILWSVDMGDSWNL